MSEHNNNTNLPQPSIPFPGSLTPGWNDPPPIAPSPANSTSANSAHRTRLDLRKRVAYPINGIGTRVGLSEGAGPNAYAPGNDGRMQPPVYAAPPAYSGPPAYVSSMNPQEQQSQQQQQQQQQYTSTGGWPSH